MGGILEGMRIVEGSAFVAVPLGGMAMAQLGADVMRFDPIGGGLDAKRWPVTGRQEPVLGGSEQGQALDPDRPQVRPGPRADRFTDHDAGPRRGPAANQLSRPRFLDYDALRARRPDLIMINVVGNYDGSSAVDYTVNLDRLPVGDRAAQPGRAVQPPAAGLGRDHGDDGHDQPACGGAPPGTHGRGAVRAAGALGCGLLDGWQSGQDRRGPDQSTRAPQGRQLSLWGLRSRFRDKGRPSRDDRRARSVSGRRWSRPPDWARASTRSRN